jgi:hypothetical protein
MLADGTLWCGSETWPDSGLSFSLEHDDKAHSQLDVTLEAPLLLPGVSLSGRKISYVETHVDAKEVRSIAWYVTATSTDRLRDPAVALTKSAVAGIDYLGHYRCQVISQSADLATVDLVPDDSRLSQNGAQNVPLRHGLPGCKVQVPSGTYVLLGWLNGDPSKPYCGLWEGGESPQSIQLAGNDGVATKKDLQVLYNAINSAAVAANDGGAALKANIIAFLGTALWSSGATDGHFCSSIVGAGR